jgi:AcrR family transcriptional regulator
MASPTTSNRNPDRREQILQVALGLFTQHGMANVTTRQIARAVGISQPSLYAHFPSAHDIAHDLCVRAFQTLHATFAAVLDAPGTPADRLERLGRAYIEFGLAHPDAYRIAFMVEELMAKPCPDPDPAMIEGLKVFAVLRAVVAEVLGRDDGETDLVAQTCWASVHGLVSLLLARAEFPWADREALIACHLRRLRDSILAPAVPDR